MKVKKRNIFGEMIEGVAAMKDHREGKLNSAQLYGGSSAAPQGGFKAASRHSKKAALFVSRVRAQVADQRK
ncbi:MAG: hypothetical protein WBX38_16280, partial [Candidatus Sulfotelmatobacter sp.]